MRFKQKLSVFIGVRTFIDNQKLRFRRHIMKLLDEEEKRLGLFKGPRTYITDTYPENEEISKTSEMETFRKEYLLAVAENIHNSKIVTDKHGRARVWSPHHHFDDDNEYLFGDFLNKSNHHYRNKMYGHLPISSHYANVKYIEDRFGEIPSLFGNRNLLEPSIRNVNKNALNLLHKSNENARLGIPNLYQKSEKQSSSTNTVDSQLNPFQWEELFRKDVIKKHNHHIERVKDSKDTSRRINLDNIDPLVRNAIFSRNLNDILRYAHTPEEIKTAVTSISTGKEQNNQSSSDRKHIINTQKSPTKDPYENFKTLENSNNNNALFRHVVLDKPYFDIAETSFNEAQKLFDNVNVNKEINSHDILDTDIAPRSVLDDNIDRVYASFAVTDGRNSKINGENTASFDSFSNILTTEKTYLIDIINKGTQKSNNIENNDTLSISTEDTNNELSENISQEFPSFDNITEITATPLSIHEEKYGFNVSFANYKSNTDKTYSVKNINGEEISFTSESYTDTTDRVYNIDDINLGTSSETPTLFGTSSSVATTSNVYSDVTNKEGINFTLSIHNTTDTTTENIKDPETSTFQNLFAVDSVTENEPKYTNIDSTTESYDNSMIPSTKILNKRDYNEIETAHNYDSGNVDSLIQESITNNKSSLSNSEDKLYNDADISEDRIDISKLDSNVSASDNIYKSSTDETFITDSLTDSDHHLAEILRENKELQNTATLVIDNNAPLIGPKSFESIDADSNESQKVLNNTESEFIEVTTSKLFRLDDSDYSTKQSVKRGLILDEEDHDAKEAKRSGSSDSTYTARSDDTSTPNFSIDNQSTSNWMGGEHTTEKPVTEVDKENHTGNTENPETVTTEISEIKHRKRYITEDEQQQHKNKLDNAGIAEKTLIGISDKSTTVQPEKPIVKTEAYSVVTDKTITTTVKPARSVDVEEYLKALRAARTREEKKNEIEESTSKSEDSTSTSSEQYVAGSALESANLDYSSED